MKTILIECIECGKSYKQNDTYSSKNKCTSCNQKRLKEKRKKDSFRKKNRAKELSKNLERLAYIEE